MLGQSQSAEGQTTGWLASATQTSRCKGKGTLNSSSCLENSDSGPPQTTRCDKTHSLSTACDCVPKPPHSQHHCAGPRQQLSLPTSNASNYHLTTPLVPPGAIPLFLMTTWSQSRVDSLAAAGSSLWEHRLCATPYPLKHTSAHLPALLNAA